MKKENFFAVLSSFHLEMIRSIVEKVESASRIEILQHPRTSFINAGETMRYFQICPERAPITQCRVSVDGVAGDGYFSGDSLEKAYCFAVIDAVLSGNHRLAPEIKKIIAQQESFITAQCNLAIPMTSEICR